MGQLEKVEIIKNIGCDFCGYYDRAEKFPEIDTPKWDRIMQDFNLDEKLVRTMYAGAICPGCGNYSSFDFHPDKKRWPVDDNQQYI